MIGGSSYEALRSSQRVAIIGAGLMGAGIAQVFASAGVPCSIYDPSPKSRSSVRSRLRAACDLLSIEVGPLLDLVTVHEHQSDACANATIVIEAGPENVAMKKQIFAELNETTAASTILASNTSSIPIRVIAEAVAEPSRVIGTHFWNPPYLVPLVEVVQGDATAPETVRKTIEILREVEMKPVHVQVDVPGCVGNRLQHALKREAIALVANGVCSVQTVDTVVRFGFGRRLALVGPLEQADLGGLDLTIAIHEQLMPDLDVTTVPHPYLSALVARGDLGAKSGRGFYAWTSGDAERRRQEINEGLVEQRSRDEMNSRVSQRDEGVGGSDE